MMTQPTDRLSKLRAMLEREPDDPFLLYGIALEHRKRGEFALAQEHFARVIAREPGNCPAHHMRAQAYAEMGDLDAARRAYREGIATAVRVGNNHARGEMEGELELLG